MNQRAMPCKNIQVYICLIFRVFLEARNKATSTEMLETCIKWLITEQLNWTIYFLVEYKSFITTLLLSLTSFNLNQKARIGAFLNLYEKLWIYRIFPFLLSLLHQSRLFLEFLIKLLVKYKYKYLYIRG